MKLPAQFDLGGKTYKVNTVKGLEKRGALGLTHFDLCEIDIDSDIKNNDLRMITFYHEVFHAMFDAMGRDDLKENEQLVDSCGTLMWQMLKSSKFTKANR